MRLGLARSRSQWLVKCGFRSDEASAFHQEPYEQSDDDERDVRHPQTTSAPEKHHRQRLGRGRLQLLIKVGPAIVWVGAQAVLSGVASSVAMVGGSDLVPRLVPERHLGVAMGAQRSLVMGVMPIAGLASGLVGSALGAGPALWLWRAFAAMVAIPILRIPR